MIAADLFFWGNVAFLLGTLLASYEFSLSFFFGIGLALALAIAISTKKAYGLLFLGVLFFGFFYFSFYFSFRALHEYRVPNKQVVVSALVIQEPKVSGESVVFLAKLNDPFGGEIIVRTAEGAPYAYGDRLFITGTMHEGQRGVWEMSFPNIVLTGSHEGFWLKESLLVLKERIRVIFNGVLSSDAAALLGGITLGMRNDFAPDLKADMAKSGVTHLVALSGYNIAILVVVMRKTLGRVMRKKIAFYVTTVIIALFVLMVGAEASVVRAALMGFLVLLARERGRRYDIRNAIIFTATVMTLFQPDIIRFDVGFQLSFASLLGLVYLEPVLRRVFAVQLAKPSILAWRDAGITTIAAQAAVLPILLVVFGQGSFLGILANTLILPLIPLTMLFGFLAACAGLLSSAMAFLPALLAAPLLFYELAVIRFFAQFSFSFDLSISPIIFTILYYGGILIFIARFYERNEKIF